MAARITDTRQKRKSTRTYECDDSTKAPDPVAHFDPGERPGGASPKKLLRKESKLLKQQGDNTGKNSRPPDEASTSSPEKVTWKMKHAQDEVKKGADTDQKIDEIELREQKFSTTDRGASDDNDEKPKDNNKNRFASLMENDMEDDDSEDEDDAEGPKDGDKMSDASKVSFDTTTTPLDSPSLSSNTKKNSEDETRTTSQHKHATRQAKRERREALLLRNKNKDPPISTQIPPPLTFENTQDMFTMIGIKSKDEIRVEDATSRTTREGHDSDISLQDYQNPTATSPTTTKTLISGSPKGQNSKNCPQETQLVRSTNANMRTPGRTGE
jgi:hypothetical protein